jgi:hypothetical protein
LLGHDNLGNYFKTNFAMMQFHKYTLTDINGMMPWERQVYVDFLHSVVKDDNARKRDAIAQQQQAIKSAQAGGQARMRPAEQTNLRQGMARK